MSKLREISRPPDLATTEGPGFRWETHGTILLAFLVTVVFGGLQFIVIPKVEDLFVETGMPMPALTRFLLDVTGPMTRALPILGMLLLAGLILGLLNARQRYVRPAAVLLAVGAIAIGVGTALPLLLPVAAGMGAGH